MATVSLPVRFASGVAPTGETTIYTTPAAQIDVITSVTFDNLTDVAATVTLKLADQFFAKSLDIPPRTLLILDFKQVLNTAENIKINASAVSTVSYFISGVKITNV